MIDPKSCTCVCDPTIVCGGDEILDQETCKCQSLCDPLTSAWTT